MSVDSVHCVHCFSSSLFTSLIIGNNVFCVNQMLEKAASGGLACQLEFPAALYICPLMDSILALLKLLAPKCHFHSESLQQHRVIVGD